MFFNIWASGHLGHVTNIMIIIFYFLVPERLHKIFGQNDPVVSEKRKLYF